MSKTARPIRAVPQLELVDLFRLQALRSTRHHEADLCALIQRPVTLGLDRREVDENVLAGFTLDESKSLRGVKPLHGSLFFHVSFNLFPAFVVPGGVNFEDGTSSNAEAVRGGSVESAAGPRAMTRVPRRDVRLRLGPPGAAGGSPSSQLQKNS